MAYLLLVFVLSHLLTDYVFQTNQLALLKSQSVRGVMLHVLITLGVSCLLHTYFFGMIGLLSAFLITSIHLLIDLLKFKLAAKFGRHQLIYFFFDQTLHFLALLLVAYLFRSAPSTIPTTVVLGITILCGWIAAVPVGTIIAKQALFDQQFFSHANGDPFFLPGERASDGLYLTAIYLLAFGGFLSGNGLLILLGLGNLFFVLDQNKRRNSHPRFYAMKTFIYVVWLTLSIAATIYSYNYFQMLLT